MRRSLGMPLLGIALLGSAATGLLARQGRPGSYAPGPLPTIGDIHSLCVERYPAPQTRTEVGIGEEVKCWIDPSTWHDMDICTDSEGKESEVSDRLGEVVWSVNGLGTVYPIVTDGSAVTLTIDLADNDGTAAVTATATDSRTLGDDPPVRKQKVFDVKTPGGVLMVPAPDKPPVQKRKGDK